MRSLVFLPLTLAAACTGAALSDPAAAPARSGRAAWVRAEIERWNHGLSASDRDEKYAAMRASVLDFQRGTNHLAWREVAVQTSLTRYGVAGWIAGDVHLGNFGSFDDGDGHIVYGLSDFDDAWMGDYQLDLWRLATSILLLADEREVPASIAERAVGAVASAYLDTLREVSGNDGELGLRFDEDATGGLVHDLLHDVAGDESPQTLLDRWTRDGRFDLDDPDLAPADAAVDEGLRSALGPGVRDVAARLHAGLASLGLPRYYVLLDDGRILDVKRARLSPGAPPGAAPVAVAAETALTGDARPRAISVGGVSYNVRPLSPWKDDLSVKKLARGDALVDTAALWGRVLAVAHARADRDASGSGASFDDAVVARVGDDDAGFVALVRARAQAQARATTADWEAWAQD